MDGTRFDQLIKSIATQRVTRLTALRGLAAGAVAGLTGLSLTADEAGADRKKPKKRKICHRGSDFTILGTTKKLKKPKAQRHLRKDPADYKGACTAAKSGLTGGTTTTTTTVPVGQPCVDGQIASNGQVCVGGNFVDCTNFTQCAANGQACINGRCRG